MKPQNKRELMIAIVQVGQHECNNFKARMCSEWIFISSCLQHLIESIDDLALTISEVYQLFILGIDSMNPSINARKLVKEYLRGSQDA